MIHSMAKPTHNLVAAGREVRVAEIEEKIAGLDLALEEAIEDERSARADLDSVENAVLLGRELATSERAEVRLEIAKATTKRKRVELEIAKAKDQMVTLRGEQGGNQ